MKNLENKSIITCRNGISLIVLVITIIVIVVLAVSVILSIANNNPIESAKEAIGIHNFKTFQEELELYKQNNYMNAQLNGGVYNELVDVTGENLLDIIPSAKDYIDKIKIENGELVVIQGVATKSEIEIAKRLNIKIEGIAGLYDENDNLLCSWEDSLIDVESDYDLYSTNEKSPYYVINNNYPNTNKVILPNGISKIGSCAFRGCSSLESITIPDTVMEIKSYAFYNCSNLESMTIPDTVTRIEGDVFLDCTSLKSVKISNSITEMSTSLFNGCSSLESITIPDTVTKLGDNVFYECSSLKSIVIPESVTELGDNVFYECSSLEWIRIENKNIESIGYLGMLPENTILYFSGTVDEWENCLVGETIEEGVNTVVCSDGTSNLFASDGYFNIDPQPSPDPGTGTTSDY